MEDIFPDDTLIRVAQKREVLSEPMSLLEADLRAKLIVYNNNEMDVWCLQNLAFDIDKRLLMMPIKVQGKPDKKIDGGVTMIGCEAVYQQFKTEYLKLVG
jgi:phage terminase large subunit-like protein